MRMLQTDRRPDGPQGQVVNPLKSHVSRWPWAVALVAVLALGLAFRSSRLAAQQNQSTQQMTAPKKPLTAAQRRAQQAQLLKELGDDYKRWLNEDVVYIITPEEREAFLQLNTDEERDQFIENFWQRRNPDPDSAYNSYKEEHYRRIAYANEHFASGEPGWKTDRGMIYIKYGAPDENDAHDGGGDYERPPEEGGGTTEVYPFEDWRYRYIDGMGENVIFEFVDTCQCGEFHLTMDPSEKDALLYVPGAGLTMVEQMGLASKDDRFDRTDGTHLGTGSEYVTDDMNEFTRIENYAKAFAPPPVEFPDLAEVVTHNITYNLLPFGLRTDFVKVTDDTVLVPFTVQIADRNITFKDENGVQEGRINVFGRISTMTDRTVDTFEQPVTLDIPSELLSQYTDKTSRYWYGALLKPGIYRVDLVLKDVNSPDKMGTLREAITVPAYKDGQLSSSTILLADDIEKVSTQQVGSGEFVIGGTKVRPVVGAQFHTDQSLGIWMQVYNLKVDPTTHKPSATVDYQIVNLATNKVVLDHSENSSDVSNAADQMTLEKTMPLVSMPLGNYKLTVKVTDNLTQHTIAPEASFSVVR